MAGPFDTQYSTPQQRESRRVERERRSGGVPSIYAQNRNIAQGQRPAENALQRQARRAQEAELEREQRRAARRIVREPAPPQTPQQASQEREFVETYQASMIDAAISARRAAADQAAKAAAHYTGAPANYVRTLISRETARTDDPRVRPSPLRGETEPRSSAVGYGQFLDDEPNRKFWRSNLPRYMIGVENMTDEEIMALREDGPISAAMIGHRANQAAAAMMGALGRRVTQGEVYLEHWAGPATAVELIRARERTPNASAAAFFQKRPNGAAIIASHRKSFYDEHGRARSLESFIKEMNGEFGDEIYEVGKRP